MYWRSLAIRGREGSILWGYRSAARLVSWSIRRETNPKRGPWELTATFAQADPIGLRQKGLAFTAPRLGGGHWYWPVLEIQVGATSILARLGPPEQ